MSLVDIYRFGPLSLSVCAPKTATREEIVDDVNTQHPCVFPPSKLRWRIADDTHFKGGEKIPHQCEDDPARQHWFMDC